MIKFGTGGWRAIIGEEFTKENIQKLALAMALKMKAEHVEDKPVVIGYDRRFLSKEAVIWSCEIFGQQGIKVLFVDRSSPTPLVMFYVMKHDLDYGMMVTASHNPAIYNGIKVFTKGGRDADEHQTADIERYLKQADELYVPDPEEYGQMPPHAYQELVKSGKVMENATVEIPEAMIERQIDSMIRNFEARLAQQGLKLADFMKYTGQDEKSFRGQYRDQAEKSVRANLVLEAIENAENFEVSDEEIDAEIEKFAKQIGQSVEELKKNLTEGDREYFKADVIRDKAVKFLCDNAKAE